MSKPTYIIDFDTTPEHYKHISLSIEGLIGTITLNVCEDGSLRPGYQLKLNSYDLGVDIELADAIERLRFEHPEVKVVVITSGKEKLFSVGANIYMLASSSHHFKVNFCKYTNETRIGIEEASKYSGQKYLAALNGLASGGGYELALAADEIILVDDGNAAVALPEAPLLAVLPGTGGLTRLVDKRMVRSDRVDVFSTLVEGVKGKRAVEWNLVDSVVPSSKFDDEIEKHAYDLAKTSSRTPSGPGIVLSPLKPKRKRGVFEYRYVRLSVSDDGRQVEVLVRGPSNDGVRTLEEIVEQGDKFWPLAMARELDQAFCHLRFNEPACGLLIFKTEGDRRSVLAVDEVLSSHQDHWLVNEIILKMGRAFKRVDQTARSIFALIEPKSCFVGSLFELALASDRSYMLDDHDKSVYIEIGPLNGHHFLKANGLSRLATRFLGDGKSLKMAKEFKGPINAPQAKTLGLVTFTPDDLDWDDVIRIAVEERLSFSPDAMTGMEASLRSAGPETLETKIFGRLAAWQNWIFQRPNAVGEKGALTLYGKQTRPEFDWGRT